MASKMPRQALKEMLPAASAQPAAPSQEVELAQKVDADQI